MKKKFSTFGSLISIDSNHKIGIRVVVGFLASLFLTLLIVGLLLTLQLRSATAAKLLTRIEAEQPSRDKFSVMMPTFRRPNVMMDTVRQIAQCKSIDKIFIIFDDPTCEPPKFDLLPGSPASYEYVIYNSLSLNNRFIPPTTLATDAILSTDDDIILSCEDMEFGFKVWQADQTAMVGFHPRLYSRGLSQPSNFRYLINTVQMSGLYTMVLTKLAFFHRKYLDEYTNSMDPGMKDYITTEHNCEDISMSFIVAKMSKRPPIFVNAFINEIEVKGISSSSGHIQRRSYCLQQLAALFGTHVVTASSVKVAQIPHICSIVASEISISMAKLCASILNF
jgi:hypothetical protein